MPNNFRFGGNLRIFQFVFCIMYRFHNSYFAELGLFLFLVKLVFLYILFYTCRSLTRVGLLYMQSFAIIPPEYFFQVIAPQNTFRVLAPENTFQRVAMNRCAPPPPPRNDSWQCQLLRDPKECSLVRTTRRCSLV